MEDYFRIGVVANTHALKGEIKVYPTTDDPSRFDDMPSVNIAQRGKVTPYPIQRVWHHKGMVVLKLEGIDNIESATLLKQADIVVARKDAIPLEQGEYYHADLVGLRVISDEGEELGHIDQILTTGANDVYSVTAEGAKPILIPAIKQCILSVDLAGGVMHVHLLKGLR